MTSKIFEANPDAKPILFSTPMVQALLSGRKTQTRRIVKNVSEISENPNSKGWFIDQDGNALQSPYGKTGDILWVRETFFDCRKFKSTPLFYNSPDFIYKANGDGIGCHKWKPSIHMPKDVCRLVLQITNVRVERLQDITEEDAIAEGVSRYPKSPIYGYKNYMDESNFVLTAKESFETLWIKINGEDSWDQNPWVWVIEFGVG